ncbi:exopolysaccharide biosynthesis protein [Marinicauda algicola]|uniref:Exopolysaccharide biosynthesis protein n=1 Tax=Marinicauda algicola TaxID=2029849 RepID=A0A4S2H489_9PROT|nr:exopolysaccharide biosynthesis protein [Marinicauda algicola]TGY90218.1 exopolysaccharide biosynthesis protein [Marinicauda algicola]
MSDYQDPIDEDVLPHGGLVAALEAIHAAAPEGGLRLIDFMEGLGERAFGVVLFALAIPVCIPFLYGVPQIVALPMMALSLQMAIGRAEPWLPARFKARMIAKADLARMARGARKWFGWLEALARPRLVWLSGPRAEQAVGAVFILFCASILVPLPLTNSTPGIAIAIASLGLITRDGLLVLAGLVLGLVWIAILTAGFLILGEAFAGVLKDFIYSLLGMERGA